MSTRAKDRIREAANKVAEERDADVLIFSGGLDIPHDGRFIEMCNRRRKKRPAAFLIAVTFGGSAHVAYRLARCLQRSYERVLACIPGPCASGGTLLVIGAHELIMSDQGALGPLDVQIRKADELGEMTSGLTAMEALSTLRSESFAMFEANLLDLKAHSGGHITLKTAMDIAQKLTVGLFEPVYAQIDPIRLGEDGRLVKIALEYGRRLDKKADNLQPEALERLVSHYPTHTFEIDREEAEELFQRVNRPNEAEEELIASLGAAAHTPSEQTMFAFLPSIKKEPAAAEVIAHDDEHSTNQSSGQPITTESSQSHGSTGAAEEEEAGLPSQLLKSIG